MIKLIKQWMLVVTLLFTPVTWANEEVPAPSEAVTETATETVQTINLNTADAEVIAQSLQGVGLSKAQAIVAYREQNGNFVAIEELTAVKGIGERTLAKNVDRIRLQE